jgi:hypothetical protein
VPELQQLVDEQERLSAQALSTYDAHAAGHLDDLTCSVEALLRRLPGVAEVEVSVRADKPTHRIIHLRDWHYVPRDLYAVGLQASSRRRLTEEEIDRLHEELCLEVEIVQLEHLALLRCLTRFYGLTRVFSEGLTPGDVPEYHERIRLLRDVEAGKMPQLREQLEATRTLKKGMVQHGRENTENYRQASDVESDLMGLMWGHKQQLLEVGIPGRLLIAEDIAEVLPLEDADLLEAAKPVTPNGKLKVDAMKVNARRMPWSRQLLRVDQLP